MISAHTMEEALDKFECMKKLFEDARMNIREFLCSDTNFSETIPEMDCH